QLHVVRELDHHESAVLQPRGQKVARLILEIRPQERKGPHFAPVHLQEFAWQPFEPDHGVDRGTLHRLPDLPDPRVERAPRSRIRRIPLPRQFQHPPDRCPARDPGLNLRSPQVDLAPPIAYPRDLHWPFEGPRPPLAWPPIPAPNGSLRQPRPFSPLVCTPSLPSKTPSSLSAPSQASPPTLRSAFLVLCRV